MDAVELYTLPQLPCVDIGMHLMHESFEHDEAEVIETARNSGVRHAIALGVDLASSEGSQLAAGRHPGFLAASIGVHPQAAESLDDEALARLRVMSQRDVTVAIGPSGLDFERMRARRSAQERALTQHIDLAVETSLPLMLWVRSAHERALEMIAARRFELGRVVLHDFGGTRAELDQWLELGCYIGFTGRLCDPRRGGELRAMARTVPIGRLLAATDAPFAAPLDLSPRVRRNEPRYLPHVVASLAVTRGDDAEALAATLVENSRHCFGLRRGDGSDVDTRLDRYRRDAW